MKPHQLVTSLLTITVWTALSCFAQNNTRTFNFPPAGLGSTETARVNLTNNAANSTGGTAASCSGSVSFLNAAGTTIGAATNFTLTTGQSSSVSLPFSSAGIAGVRGVIRAQVHMALPTISANVRTPPCQLLTSFEIFDTGSGATHVLIDGGSQVIGGIVIRN